MAASASTPSGLIFLSYRRQDTAYPAGWLYARLVARFGQGRVFKDLHSIDPGDDFVEVLTAAVSSCSALLALIGRRWASVTDKSGARRIDSPGDFVRLEIEVALERNVEVVPVLVDGARIPPAASLPPTLAGLVERPHLELGSSRFSTDIDELVTMLERTLSDGNPPGRTPAATVPLTPADHTAWLVANGYATPVIRP